VLKIVDSRATTASPASSAPRTSSPTLSTFGAIIPGSYGVGGVVVPERGHPPGPSPSAVLHQVAVIEELKQAWADLTAEGAPFSWSVQEVRGVPTRVYDAAPATMRQLWEASAGHGDTDYLVYQDERYSYADVHAGVRSLAHTLHARFGVGEGDRVAVAMRNYPEWVVSYWAVTSLGAAVVGINAWWTGAEMEFALSDSRPSVLIADEERIQRLADHPEALRAAGDIHLIAVRSDRSVPIDAHRWEDLVDIATAPDTLPPAFIDTDDDACIFYTSGTTGSPKGAQLTHRGSIHNVMNMGFVTMAVAQARSRLPTAQPEGGDGLHPTVLLPVPLFHVTGCNCVLHPATAIGARVVLMHRWDADHAVELIEREKVTVFTGVPTMSREMLLSPRWKTADTSSLASMSGGGAAVQPDLVEKIDRGLSRGRPQAGYGLTETHGIVSLLGNVFLLHRPESVGPAVPVMEVRCVDEHGDPVGPGELGELVVRGPNVIKGYLNRPDATAEAIVDGWFHTGDVAFIDDDGFIHIRDRIKDIVIRGGENVHCGEVETAIYEHPAVAEAAVFGVPDEKLGEEVGVAIVTAPGTSLTESELAEFLEPRLAAYKRPCHVWFLDQPLPRNANGKFVKRELKEILLGEDGDDPTAQGATKVT
jgi:long-chain acyl-CoA synthetase